MRVTTNINEAGIGRAIRAGVDYILSLQSAQGYWREWQLPPGSSTRWTTGYIGYRLRGLPALIKEEVRPRLALAGNWLLENKLEDGGWGYHSSVGSDADSTAYAILFLTSIKQPVPDAAFAHLIRYQSSNGGFGTYWPVLADDSWTLPHPDVTAMALLALSGQRKIDQLFLQRGVGYVLKERTPDFWWNAFWWSSGIYATEANLAFLDAVGIQFSRPVGIERFKPKNAFESALLVSSLGYLNTPSSIRVVKKHIDMLLTRQRADGSWNTAPILRITRRDCATPWTCDNAGPLFSDDNRLFTTVTVIEALSKYVIMCPETAGP